LVAGERNVLPAHEPKESSGWKPLPLSHQSLFTIHQSPASPP
jgi:hypothetical protein